jgi:hypothetical protein
MIRMRRSALTVWTASIFIVIAADGHAMPQDANAVPPDAEQEVTFDAYTPLSSNLGLAGRFLSPLTADQLSGRLSAHNSALREQPVDLAAESFRVFVPATQPAAGYALLVFIPPWQDDHVPATWRKALAARGMIFVSAARSGNEENLLARREPLALLAAYNVMQHYAVDAERIYIGGFSGGSRVALRVALAYPDLFRGALLDAGSDPIGEPDFPLPPLALFEQFRARSRLVYLTGSDDNLHIEQEMGSRNSLRRWCVSNVFSLRPSGLGHALAPSPSFELALKHLEDRPAQPDSRQQKCWSKQQQALDEDLAAAQQAIAAGQTATARSRLRRIDEHFAGLAAPRSVELQHQLAEAP